MKKAILREYLKNRENTTISKAVNKVWKEYAEEVLMTPKKRAKKGEK